MAMAMINSINENPFRRLKPILLNELQSTRFQFQCMLYPLGKRFF